MINFHKVKLGLRKSNRRKGNKIINDDIYLAISLLIIYLCVYEWSVCQNYG